MQRYGVSNKEYLDMINSNKNCPICDRELKDPCIDHDHKTGKVRGMICNHCNISLNIIEDNVKLKKAIEYLNRGK